MDGLGRPWIADETITNAGQSGISHSYTNQYDMRSQLLSASMTNVGGLTSVTNAYSYDKAGNVQSHTYTPNPGSEAITTYGYIHDTLESDLMESATGGENFDPTWDENGNMTAKGDTGDTEVEYNWDNKLRSAAKVIESTESSISVKYDPMGNRVWRQTLLNGSPTATRKYVVDISGGLPTILMEINPSNGNVLKTYVYANGEILMQHNGPAHVEPPAEDVRHYYLHDRLGSVRILVDKNGNVVNNYSYEPFGEMIAAESTETTENSFKFTGQFYDSEIGQYYLRARQYDPQLMRFTARDPVRGRFNKPLTLHVYLYCLNDPVNRTDLSGETSAKALIIPVTAGYATHALAIAFAAYAVTYDKDAAMDLGIALEKSIGAVMTLVSTGVNYWDALVRATDSGKQKDRDNFGKLKEIGEEYGKTLEEVRDAIHRAKKWYRPDGGNLTEDEIREILENL